MRKIGGINMNTAVRMTRTNTKDKEYCSVYESLEDSCKELKKIKEKKIKPKTWEELFKELKNNEE